MVHSEHCMIGTSHNFPADCKGVDYKPIPYEIQVEEPEVGHSEPETNSEEGRRALAALEAAVSGAEGSSGAPTVQGEPESAEAITADPAAAQVEPPAVPEAL